MSYCPDCGVEIGNAKQCPLCGTPNPRACEEKNLVTDSIDDQTSSKEEICSAEKRTTVWEVLSVTLAIAILVLGSINLFESRRFSWSLYAIVSIFFIWVELTAFFMLRKRVVFRILLSVLAPPFLFITIGYISGGQRWALGLAVPIIVIVESIIGLVYLLFEKSKQKGLNLIAYMTVAIALLCFCLEVFIDLFANGVVVLQWSPICAIALLSIAVFFLYLHFRVFKNTDLHRIFHF